MGSSPVSLGAFRARRCRGRKGRTDSVRGFLLEETPAFPWQFDDIKAQLAGHRLPGRAAVYRFPVRPE